MKSCRWSKTSPMKRMRNLKGKTMISGSAAVISFRGRCYFRTTNPGSGRKSRCQNVATETANVEGLALNLCQQHADAVRDKSYTVVSTVRGIFFRELMKAFEFTKVEVPEVSAALTAEAKDGCEDVGIRYSISE